MPERCSDDLMQPLDEYLAHALRLGGAKAGTVHERFGSVLKLRAAQGIPAETLGYIQEIPFGKGMAGEAWATGHPVMTCNLRTDPAKVIQPGARAVDAQNAVALPLKDEDGRVQYVVGFAFEAGTTDSPLDLEMLTNVAQHLVLALHDTASNDL